MGYQQDGVALVPKEVGVWDSLMAMQLDIQENWLGSFLLNLLSYALIILPAAYFIRRWKNDPAVKSGRKLLL